MPLLPPIFPILLPLSCDVVGVRGFFASLRWIYRWIAPPKQSAATKNNNVELSGGLIAGSKKSASITVQPAMTPAHATDLGMMGLSHCRNGNTTVTPRAR